LFPSIPNPYIDAAIGDPVAISAIHELNPQSLSADGSAPETGAENDEQKRQTVGIPAIRTKSVHAFEFQRTAQNERVALPVIDSGRVTDNTDITTTESNQRGRMQKRPAA
jgi:hypothetical protein